MRKPPRSPFVNRVHPACAARPHRTHAALPHLTTEGRSASSGKVALSAGGDDISARHVWLHRFHGFISIALVPLIRRGHRADGRPPRQSCRAARAHRHLGAHLEGKRPTSSTQSFVCDGFPEKGAITKLMGNKGLRGYCCFHLHRSY